MIASTYINITIKYSYVHNNVASNFSVYIVTKLNHLYSLKYGWHLEFAIYHPFVCSCKYINDIAYKKTYWRI